MESLNEKDLNNQQEDNAVRTAIQLTSIQGEHQTTETETLIVPGGVHPVPQPQCQTYIAVIDVDPPISVPGLTEPLIPLPDQQDNGNCLENFILGSNKSNPIWKLRLLCALCLAVATVVCIQFYPDKDTDDWLVKLKFIVMFSVPILVALMTLVASFASNLDEAEVTGLSVTNTSMLVAVAGSLIGLRQK